MAHDKAADAAALDAAFLDVRQRIRDYLITHNEFYPGLYDGPRVVPRNELLANCRVLPNRLDIIARLPTAGCFAEVGTLYGDFIVDVIEINRPSEVHLFDFSFEPLRPQNRARLDAFGHVTYNIGDSSTQLASFADAFFDIVYVDADHSYVGVLKDLHQALRVLKPDGWLVCNDYTLWDATQCLPYGVYSAINRFANENDLRFEFLALHPDGFHDVALRRAG
ncbi:MAG: class I SAM-dependent methyltransferase [Acetobacteraceae bacterium]|jgi:SAM-dependent methyltransferase